MAPGGLTIIHLGPDLGGAVAIGYARPPILIHDVIGDVSAVVGLLESQAPYTPLGGWYSPGADPHARTRPMWFQKDWVHGHFFVCGAPLGSFRVAIAGQEQRPSRP